MDFYSPWALLDFYFGGALRVLLSVLHLALLSWPLLYLALRFGGVESPVYHSYWRKQVVYFLQHIILADFVESGLRVSMQVDIL